MPRGGPRPGGGRPKGSRNSPASVRAAKAMAEEITALSREEAVKRVLGYVTNALTTLNEVMQDRASPQARVTAAKDILDRALGKAREAPPEAVQDPMKDITPQGLNGHGV